MRQVMLTYRAQEQLLEHTLLAVYENRKSIESATRLNRYFDSIYRIFQDRDSASIIELSQPCAIIRRTIEEYSSWIFPECYRFINGSVDDEMIRIVFHFDENGGSINVLTIDVEQVL